MSDTYTSMKNSLSTLSIYEFEGTNISNELKAYALVLDEINAELSEMIDECFIDTASSYGLSQRELTIGAVRDDLTIDKRREMLKLRESICKSSFTVEKIKESLRSFGLQFELKEYPSLYIVNVDARGSYSQKEQAWIRTEVEKIMPAHLSIQVIFCGPTWDESDSKDNTFSYIESLCYSWDTIDNLE